MQIFSKFGKFGLFCSGYALGFAISASWSRFLVVLSLFCVFGILDFGILWLIWVSRRGCFWVVVY